MPKPQTIFSCIKCGAQFPKWTGRCSTCGAWGTVSEEANEQPSGKIQNVKIDTSQLLDLKSDKTPKFERLQTNIGEFDRVLGGGIVNGSLILLGGEPGIGKSTLVLQICHHLKSPILYVSGEESASQIKMRVDRLNLNFTDFKFLAENNIEKVCAFGQSEKPSLIIIDSIQTLYSNELPSEAGSINQVRICTVRLLELAKKYNIAILIIGHVTKDGQVAGPKSLEHLVDAVMYLESSTSDDFRLLRCAKNRFGSTQEIGIFSMTGKGMEEVKNPSELFLPQNQEAITGSVITCIMEGTRPFLIEIQALVTKTMFGYPQRRSSGFDLNRLQMLAAVLIKRANVPLLNQDIHLNVTGGLKINETGADLAICMAIVSSLKNKAISPETIVLGEVGLGGEIRPIYQLDKRIEEARKLNFKKIIVPQAKNKSEGKEIISVSNLEQAIKEIL
jgi:DNA repair protein RadA/Sms